MLSSQVRRMLAISGSLAVVAVGGSYAAGAFAQGGSPAAPATHTTSVNQHHTQSRTNSHGSDALEPGEDATEHADPGARRGPDRARHP